MTFSRVHLLFLCFPHWTSLFSGFSPSSLLSCTPSSYAPSLSSWTVCTTREWQCDYGTCIARQLRCNGRLDCPYDDSDERECKARKLWCNLLLTGTLWMVNLCLFYFSCLSCACRSMATVRMDCIPALLSNLWHVGYVIRWLASVCSWIACGESNWSPSNQVRVVRLVHFAFSFWSPWPSHGLQMKLVEVWLPRLSDFVMVGRGRPKGDFFSILSHWNFNVGVQ